MVHTETDPYDPPSQSAYFRALQSSRYERQKKIYDYEESTGRSLVVFWGPITTNVITPFADAINDVPSDCALDVMLTSYGGNGEVALRLATMCHAEREDFRVVVPDTAASAATLLALAAESIVMSNTSALGPIDPQIEFPAGEDYVPAKDIVSIVEDIVKRVKDDPRLLELYAHFMGDVDAVVYQQARSAMERTKEFVPEVLALRQKPLSSDQIEKIVESLHNQPMHSTTIGPDKARKLGMPIEYMDSRSVEWDRLWRLHTDYVAKHVRPLPANVIEGRRVSFTFVLP